MRKLLLSTILALLALGPTSLGWAQDSSSMIDDQIGTAILDGDSEAIFLPDVGLAEKRKPRPTPQPVALATNELQTAGLAIFPEQGCWNYFGSQKTQEMADGLLARLNDTNARSLVAGCFGLTDLEVGIKASDSPGYLDGTWANPKLHAAIVATGADLWYPWGDVFISGEGSIPTRKQDFTWVNGGAFTSCYAEVEEMAHEVGHLGGLQHNPEAPHPPVSSTWSTAVGKFDGVHGDETSYPIGAALPVLSGPDTGLGDDKHNNAAMARLSFPWIAAYNSNPPLLRDRECREDINSACLSGVRVSVRLVPLYPLRPGIQSLDGVDATHRLLAANRASFTTGAGVVRVTLSSRQVRRNKAVVDLSLVAPAPPSGWVYTVWFVNSDGRFRVWRSTAGGYTLSLAALFP